MHARAVLRAQNGTPQVTRRASGSFAPVVSAREWLILLIETETAHQSRQWERERSDYDNSNALA
jgi:hypothetical protein